MPEFLYENEKEGNVIGVLPNGNKSALEELLKTLSNKEILTSTPQKLSELSYERAGTKIIDFSIYRSTNYPGETAVFHVLTDDNLTRRTLGQVEAVCKSLDQLALPETITKLNQAGVKVVISGDGKLIPDSIKNSLRTVIDATANNTNYTLCLLIGWDHDIYEHEEMAVKYIIAKKLNLPLIDVRTQITNLFNPNGEINIAEKLSSRREEINNLIDGDPIISNLVKKLREEYQVAGIPLISIADLKPMAVAIRTASQIITNPNEETQAIFHASGFPIDVRETRLIGVEEPFTTITIENLSHITDQGLGVEKTKGGSNNYKLLGPNALLLAEKIKIMLGDAFELLDENAEKEMETPINTPKLFIEKGQLLESVLQRYILTAAYMISIQLETKDVKKYADFEGIMHEAALLQSQYMCECVVPMDQIFDYARFNE
jgi:hypothetical protein